MNHPTSNISTIDIDLTSVSIATFYFDYFTLILLVAYAGTPPLRQRQGQTKLKQTKLGQFLAYRTETGQCVHYNFTYHMIRPFDCTVLPSDSLKKERLCLKIVLGQTRFEVYSASYYLPCDHSIVVRIGSAC